MEEIVVRPKKEKTKRVINGDTMKIVQYFEETKLEEIIKKYKSLGYAEVLPDNDNDVIIYWEPDLD
jgi:uncharacterized metal-binding protein